MEIEITEERENRLLGRKEVFFRLCHEEEGEKKGASPSRPQARDALIKKLQCNPNLLVIDRMRTEFGKRETVGYAKVYENEDRLREIEREHIIKRNFGQGEKEEKGE
jgi:small subunit ribosomal protein S24e